MYGYMLYNIDCIADMYGYMLYNIDCIADMYGYMLYNIDCIADMYGYMLYNMKLHSRPFVLYLNILHVHAYLNFRFDDSLMSLL